MRMIDIIEKKKRSKELTKEELEFFTSGVADGSIPDYQVSAFLMAVYFNGMTDKETAKLTLLMAESGDMADLSSIDGYKVDKHSTGGVGDKTSLIVVPVVASLGIKVAKMSGRGLGHTGGTIDKLESIPGYNTALTTEKFFKVVNEVGASIVGQTGNFAPVDKKLYALRDVTATVDSIPLIAASIMSKKLASGADGIVLDVKTGSGAFCKTEADAEKLAKTMVSIGEHAGRDVRAVISDMDRPLGHAVGNNIEVIEAVNTLLGEGPEDLRGVSIELASNMVAMAKKISFDEAKKEVTNAIDEKKAFESLCAMVKAQGGDEAVLRNTELFPKAKYSYDLLAEDDGFISGMDTYKIGVAASVLGAGRETKDSPIDFTAGIYMHKKTGDKVNKGDVIATLLTNKEESISDASNIFKEAVSYSKNLVKASSIIKKRITKEDL